MSYQSYSIRADRPMRSPKRAFMVNDIVRLNRGWTPMTISWISPDGQVTAHYGIQDFNPEGGKNPDCMTSSYTRHHTAWSWWDGEFIPGRNLPMARRFTVNNQPNRIGQLTGFTSNGFFILEMETSEIEVFAETEITEIKPFSFSVRYQNGSLATYTFENPTKRVELNDVLITEIGDVCIVTKVDVNANRPKNFTGRKLVSTEI